jgi:hypothetical protein
MKQQPRDIVIAAYNYLVQVIPPTQKVGDARVEEIVPMPADESLWRVVLSYDSLGATPFDTKREYKQFSVRDADATVISMTSVAK